MGDISTAFNSGFPDYNVPGSPSSGKAEPRKSVIRTIGPLIDNALSTVGAAIVGAGGVMAQTLSALNANLAPAAGAPGFVFNDGSNNGLYVKLGATGTGSWSFSGITLASTVTLAMIGEDALERMFASVEAAGSYALAGSWTPSFVVTDPSGNKLLEITPAQLNHPDVNAIRTQGASNAADIATNAAAISSLEVVVQQPGAWTNTFVVTDPSGHKLAEITPSQINHPDTNAMRAQLALLPSFGTAIGWQSSFLITDLSGYLLMEVKPTLINHPDINAIRSQVASNTAAISQVTGQNSRINHGFAFIGDSRLAQMYSTFGAMGVVQNRWHWWHKANWQLGNAMQMVLNLAVSGQRSDQYGTQANLNTAMATAAKNLVVYGIVNDVGQGFTAAQIWNGYNGSPGIKSIVQQAVAQGMRVILGLEAGSLNLNSAAIGEVNKYRQLCYELKETQPNVELLDLAQPIWGGSSLSTTAISFLPGVMQVGDQTHPGTLGGAYATPNMVALAQRIGIVPIQRKVIAPWEVGANNSAGGGGCQLIQNGLFLTTTGGTGGAGITGNIPANWTAVVGGTGLITGTSFSPSTVGGGADFGTGNDFTITATGAASGDNFRIFQAINTAGLSGEYPAPVAGNIYQGGVEVSVAAGSSNFVGTVLFAGPNFSDSTFMQFDSGYAQPAQGAGPTYAYTDTLETDKFTIPTGKTFSFWSFNVEGYFAGAGAAQITIRQAQLRQRYT